MTQHSIAHGAFHIERTYPDVTPRRVFDAFATESGKAAWFVAQSDKWTLLEREFDFRPGGRERLKSRWQSGLVSLFDAIYFDIVPGERIVYAYDLWHEDRKLSVSLATLEFHAADGGTKFKLCEQGAFLDGYDDAGAREHGTNELMDRMEATLSDQVSAERP
jgi:uncharacterized protein YndB with AHSA1/START domain